MVAICARRGSGKSELVKYLLSVEPESFEKVIVISCSEGSNNFFKGFLDPRYVFEDWSEELVESIFEKVSKINRGVPKEKQKRYLLILDDIIGDLSFRNSKILKKIFIRSRHVNLALVSIVQHLHEVSPLQRSNLDVLLVSQMANSCVDSLAVDFACGEISKAEFISLYHRSITNYQFLLVNNSTTKTGALSEIYGTIKTPSEFFD